MSLDLREPAVHLQNYAPMEAQGMGQTVPGDWTTWVRPASLFLYEAEQLLHLASISVSYVYISVIVPCLGYCAHFKDGEVQVQRGGMCLTMCSL